MPDRSLRVTDVRFTPAGPAATARGLEGWISLELGSSVVLDGLALRRTCQGMLALTFPRRRDRAGREHPIVRPLDDAVRREIERQVFEALGLEEAE